LRAFRQEDDPVNLRFKSVVAAAVGLCVVPVLAGRSAAQAVAEPARLGVAAGQAALAPAAEPGNQHLADAIAFRLRQSGQLRCYHIGITVENGTAELRGQVASAAQREDAVRIARQVAGVVQVRDLLVVAGGGIAQVQGVVPGPLAEPKFVAPRPAEVPGMPPAPGVPGVPGVGGIPPEPTPIFQAPPGAPSDMNQPPMPPYAWPTYAPYNNYSRVAYPELYPYQSWPFIGPMYPFPKVPLGWRSIKLEWYDGYWWYGKTPTGHDWWRIRYW
jgi:hypothetical protein